ncbi:DUF6882 domain-containing protein [Ekhidna sp.]|uniref:DUF6882 domain-containing protein n=1 Tax=Ekhidna sp. TaxID=2608089 RepID=UPI003B507BCE
MTRNFLLILLIFTFGCNQLRTVNEQDLSKPEATDAFRDYLTTAHNYLTEQQDICRNDYGLNNWERWYYDDETGILEFLNGDTVKLRIKYQQVGTVSEISNTWLWAWANPNLEDNIKIESKKVSELGEQKDFERLTKRKWNADEVDGWEMTSIMAYLTNSKGAYRIPGDSVIKFIVFKELELVN